MRPKTSAPSGRAEAGAEGGEAGEKRRPLVGGREEELPEEDRERAVEVEVVPLEERAEARREDDAPERSRVGLGARVMGRGRSRHAAHTVRLEGASFKPAIFALTASGNATGDYRVD